MNNPRQRVPDIVRDSQVPTDFHGMVGQSAAMRTVYERIERFARSPIPILLQGETGTGKDMAAEAIRRLTDASGPFVAVNCGAITRTLMESELFGHEQGAFTGATRRHTGILARADGGILFLDEIAELSLPTQSKLLRALESGEYCPVGGERLQRSRFRLIAATNQDLDELVRRRRFRLDLLHRLGVARITVPPLRERLEDLPMLSEEFLFHFRKRGSGKRPGQLSSAALHLCASASWPGNVRQFKHVVEAAAILAPGVLIGSDHVAEFIDPAAGSLELRPTDSLPTLAEVVGHAEIEHIRRVLERAEGDRNRAADLLGISAATLYRRLSVYPPDPACTRQPTSSVHDSEPSDESA